MTETKITNKINKLKESLGPFNKPPVLYACGMLICLIGIIFAYRPLIIKLYNAAKKLNEVEIELLNQQSAIAALENSDITGVEMQRNEVPLVIAELAEKARKLGLNFSSISPSQLQETAQAGIYKLPIGFAIESEYKNIGQFLAYVEGFSRSVAEVESFSIRPIKKNIPQLNIELVLNLYMEIENETQ